METVDIRLHLPKEIAKAVATKDTQLEKILWEKIVLELYREETVSFGKACELLGISKWEFADLLKQKNFTLAYDKDDLEQDLKTLKDIELW